jgi:hypothetical protein
MNLKKIIKEQIQSVLLEMAEPVDEATKEQLVQYVAWLRALHLWFHGAHHITSGPSFGADHVELYGKFYLAIQDEVDPAMEKIIGLTNDKNLGCPTCVASKALEIMQRFPSPKSLSPTAIARTGLTMEKEYIKFVEDLFRSLELKNMLSLGLNDQLAASVNAHETNIYLLQQRVYKNFEEY